MGNIIPSLVGSARVHAYHYQDEPTGLHTYWRDIGTLDSYCEASMDLIRAPTVESAPMQLSSVVPSGVA